jgi:hypothetical protein
MYVKTARNRGNTNWCRQKSKTKGKRCSRRFYSNGNSENSAVCVICHPEGIADRDSGDPDHRTFESMEFLKIEEARMTLDITRFKCEIRTSDAFPSQLCDSQSFS